MLRHGFRSTVLAAALVLLAAPALAQQPQKKQPAQKPPPQTDAELIARLHELTRAKGIYATRIGPDFCRRLGSRPTGLCEAFKSEFTEGGKMVAEFYSLNDARKRHLLHLFITSYLQPNYIDDYRVGTDGKLERGVRRRGDASARLSVIDGTADFNRVMKFLHENQDQLAELPDAKIVDDGSCPKDQFRRIPQGPKAPKDGVCLDRARLEVQVLTH